MSFRGLGQLALKVRQGRFVLGGECAFFLAALGNSPVGVILISDKR